MAHGACFMAHALWLMAHGTKMVPGSWLILVHGSLHMAEPGMAAWGLLMAWTRWAFRP